LTVSENCSRLSQTEIEIRFIGSRGTFSLALGLDKRLTGGARQDHTTIILRIFDGSKDRTFTALHFRGPISSLDFRNIKFEQCHFKNAEFVNCTFNERTRFIECFFDDQFAVTSCESFSRVQFDHCSFSLQARGVVQREQGEQHLAVTRQQIVAAVRDALRYFQAGAAGFSTRKVELLNVRLRHVPFANKLLTALEEHHVLERKPQSGAEEFTLIRTADARVFLQNRTQIGHIKRVIDQLERQLC
jgi:hypothetical protein